jgi:AcrR family transcriptional regulator
LVHNSDENEDLRIRRTRKMIQEAMIGLTVEKGFANISVRDITERAMVNRSTFYRHYLDKCDLVCQYMKDVYALTSRVDIAPEKHARNEPPQGLINLLKHINTFSDFYRVMLGTKGDPGFVEDFRKNTEDRLRFMFSKVGAKHEPNSAPMEMRLSYTSYAAVGAIVWWLENNKPCTVEQLARWISQLNRNNTGILIKPTEDRG